MFVYYVITVCIWDYVNSEKKEENISNLSKNDYLID
jgi:hypothetical protein